MDNVVSTFPLLRLPKKAVLIILRTMRYPQMFGISLLSEKTKNLVESLKLKTRIFHVEVRHYLSIMLFFQNYESICIEIGRIQVDGPLEDLDAPGSIFILSEHPRKWAYSLSVGQLLDHLKLICHSPITKLMFSASFEKFNLGSVHRNIKNFKKLWLNSRNHELNKRVISLFKPSSITLESRALANDYLPRDILIQNFDVVHVPNMHITLDELLITNLREINMFCRRFSGKMLNRFIKLWIKGSNPRLELMFLGFHSPGFQNEELLRGLKYRELPRKTVRLFKSSGNRTLKRVRGGWDIWRTDGTKATIIIQRSFGSVDFKLFVWHDHCVVE